MFKRCAARIVTGNTFYIESDGGGGGGPHEHDDLIRYMGKNIYVKNLRVLNCQMKKRD
ncbi:MAG: hypothetical protein KJ718_02865 [Nanoarchaeota archaeon]|nr:hypothetical protein [Nanoarchaeota archaeon]MBU1051470.1 hypothetical protein [Nanoarchaeota archaeon]MBU1988411.1 hypothetical protein [Nanoarchaeota archaeon]